MPTPCHALNLPSPGAYVSAWRKAKTSSANTYFHVSWDRPSVPRDEVLREFATALHRRINVRGGRDCDNAPIPSEWIRDQRRVDDKLNRRVRVYQFETATCRKRFAHLLSSWDDDK